MLRIVASILAKNPTPPIQINVKPHVPHIPWTLLAASGVIALLGMAFWKTTIGKFAIAAGIGGLVVFVVMSGGSGK